MIHCKVINGAALAAQHRLLVVDWEIQRGKKRKPEQATPRKKWLRLKKGNLKVQCRENVLDKVRPVESVQELCGYDNWTEVPMRRGVMVVEWQGAGGD